MGSTTVYLISFTGFLITEKSARVDKQSILKQKFVSRGGLISPVQNWKFHVCPIQRAGLAVLMGNVASLVAYNMIGLLP